MASKRMHRAEQIVGSLQRIDTLNNEKNISARCGTMVAKEERYDHCAPVHMKDSAGFGSSLSDDAKMIGEMEVILAKSEKFCNMLYTMRALSPALYVKTTKKMEKEKEVWHILRPRVVQLLELCVFSEEIITCFERVTKTLVRRRQNKSKSRKLTPDLVYDRLIMLVEVLVLLDNLKDIKSSVLNDFAAYKRSMAIVRDDLDEHDYDTEVKKLQFFLSHPKSPKSAMFYDLSTKVQRIAGYEELMVKLLQYCRMSMGSDNDHTVEEEDIRYLLPSEKHRFLLVIPHLFLLIDQKDKRVNAFKLESLRKKPFRALLKANPVVPLYRDMSIQPYYILRRCPNWDESDAYRWAPTEDSEAKMLPAAYNLEMHWQQMRTDHSKYMVKFTRMVNALRATTKERFDIANSVGQNMAQAATPRHNAVKAAEVGGGMSNVKTLARGFKLLAKWQSLIREHMAWKLLHHAEEVPIDEAHRFDGLKGVEYAKAIRWNLSATEVPVIIDMVTMIKTLFGMMTSAEVVLAPHIRAEIHGRLQRFAQVELVPLLYKTTKKKRPVKKSLVELRAMMADWSGGSIPSDMNRCEKAPRSTNPGARPRCVGPGPTQLALFQMILQLMFHSEAEGMNRGWWSGKDFDDQQVKVLDKMYKECFFFPYILQYGDTLRQLGDLGDLLFREYMLEVTHCTQFPLAMSFPWILIEHLLDSRADINTMDNLLHVLDIYNDASHRALYVIKQQHLYNEVEAEVNLVFDQISILLSEKVYSYAKDCASFLELPPIFRTWLQKKKPGKFCLEQERFAVALSQKHIELLGRVVDLSSILCQYIGNYFYQDMEYILRKFEARGLEYTHDIEHGLKVMRRMHKILNDLLGGQLDSFDTILNCTREAVSPTSFNGRIMDHIQEQLVKELFPWYIFNWGSRRYVRVPGAEAQAGSRCAVPKKAYNFFGWGVKCNAAYERFFRIRRHYIGVPHIEAMVRLIGASELPSLAAKLLDTVVEVVGLNVCPALEQVAPDMKPHKMHSATTAIANCAELLYYRTYLKVSKLKANVALRPVVMHSLRNLGNALSFLRLLEDVVTVEESKAFLQVAPLLGVGRKHKPLSEAAKGLESVAAAQGQEAERGALKHLHKMAKSAEELYKPLAQKVLLLPQALRLIMQVLEDELYESLRGQPPANGALDHTSKASRLEFHRIWSSIYFMYCMHDEESGAAGLGDAKFGDGFFWAACTMLHLLDQRRRFELLDLSYYLSTAQEIEMSRVSTVSRDGMLESLRARFGDLKAITVFFNRVKQSRKLINLIFSELESTGVGPTRQIKAFAPPTSDRAVQDQRSLGSTRGGMNASMRGSQQSSNGSFNTAASQSGRTQIGVAKWAYESSNDGELSFKKGDELTIIDVDADGEGGWSHARGPDGKDGLVPAQYFRLSYA